VGLVSELSWSDQSDDVCGIDIGATKTHLALERADGTVAEQWVPTPSWRNGSSVGSASALVPVLVAAFGTAVLTRPLAVGAHGCDTTEQCQKLQDDLDVLTTSSVLVVNDAELMPWAMGIKGGVGVVAGTGSIAVTRDQNGEMITAGGWGWILGDEGSASAIVREAVRAVLLRRDLGEPDDPLARRMFAAFGAGDSAELAMALSRDSSAHRWGAQAPHVFTAADEGSRTAAAVIEQAGRGLADLIDRLIQRGLHPHDVVVGGSVIVAQARLRNAFLGRVTASHPEVGVTMLTRSPVHGALALARSGLTRLAAEPTPSTDVFTDLSAALVPEERS